MLKFSANLGFLWQELTLDDAIGAAYQAGFNAVECHWPYSHKSNTIKTALDNVGLSMLSINTSPGNLQQGEFGLSAVPGSQKRAKQAIDQAIEFACEIACSYVHVMAGKSDASDQAEFEFCQNLAYACEQANQHGLVILIEPINDVDMPGYHLTSVEQAICTLTTVDQPNLKILFDCYHVATMGDDVLTKFVANQQHIAHIQFASVPGRSEPSLGDLNYKFLLNEIINLGYQGYFGAEYKPQLSTAKGLTWLNSFNKN